MYLTTGFVVHLISNLTLLTLYRKKCEFKSTLTTEMKQMFVDILQEMKALAEPVQRRLKQRHEPWVDLFREQVDIAPGKGTPRRVVDVQELAEILTLANQVSWFAL
jgi:hypothetical protein